MATVKVTVKKNGDLRFEAPAGSVELVDGDGNPYDLGGKTAFSLCRCGSSTKRPFCDGSHRHNGFQSAECAPPKPETA
jgi:CDGSH-type Zn-finger protein